MQFKSLIALLAGAVAVSAIPQAASTVSSRPMQTFTMTKVVNTIVNHSPFLIQTTQFVTYTQPAPEPTTSA